MSESEGLAMDFPLPELGEGVYEAEFVRWLVKPGEAIKRGQTLMEVMTDKATMEVPAPFAGTVTALQAEPGTQVKVGDVVLTYAAAGEAAAPAPEPAKRQAVAKSAKVAAAKPSNGSAVPVKAAPSVRHMARQMGIDINRVRGSGPQGRVLIEDLRAQLRPAQTSGADSAPAPKTEFGTPGTRIKLQGLRRVIAERMVQSKRTIPHYTYVDECDISEVVKLRDGLR